MRLSLVFATRNRAPAVARLLERLAAMNAPPDWEIVIADNGSTDDTAGMLDSWAGRLPLITVNVPVPGKSRALNAALAHTSGDLILFTDDDVEPRSEWLFRWSEMAASHPEARIFGGRISVDPAEIPQWIMHSGNLQEMLVSLHDWGEQNRLYPYNRYPIGPNMAVRRNAIIATGARWREDLGPGTAVPLGDERAFLSQISAPADRDRLYLTGVEVTHCPQRKELSRVRCWQRCYLGGLAAGRIDRTPGLTLVPIGSAVISRLRHCGSLSELVAMGCRALGVFAGRLGY